MDREKESSICASMTGQQRYWFIRQTLPDVTFSSCAIRLDLTGHVGIILIRAHSRKMELKGYIEVQALDRGDHRNLSDCE